MKRNLFLAFLICMSSSTLYSGKLTSLAMSMVSDNPIIVTTSLCSSIYSTAHKWYTRKQASQFPESLPNAQASKTIFAFDLHHVMFQPNLSIMMYRFLTMPHKYALLKTILSPFLIINIIKLIFHGNVMENVMLQLAEKHPSLQEFIDDSMYIANGLTPIEGTFYLIKELKQRGYPIYLLSNIGKNTFNDLKKDFPYHFDDFDELFMASPEEMYLHKPDLRMYNLFLDTYGLKAEDVVFIDDRADNVNAARKVGIHSILFTSPHHLECVLRSMGALENNNKPVMPAKECSPYANLDTQFVENIAIS